MKDKHLVVRVSPEKKKEIKQLALDLDLTIVDLILKAIEEYKSKKDKEV